MDLRADWGYILDLAARRRRSQNQWYIPNDGSYDIIGAAGELAARRFFGLPEDLHAGYDGGVDFIYRGVKVDVKSTLMRHLRKEGLLQWPRRKEIKADIVLLMCIDLEAQRATPVGYATRDIILNARQNDTSKVPCFEVPIEALENPCFLEVI
jgi:hypothetical protein